MRSGEESSKRNGGFSSMISLHPGIQMHLGGLLEEKTHDHNILTRKIAFDPLSLSLLSSSPLTPLLNQPEKRERKNPDKRPRYALCFSLSPPTPH